MNLLVKLFFGYYIVMLLLGFAASPILVVIEKVRFLRGERGVFKKWTKTNRERSGIKPIYVHFVKEIA